MHAIEMLAHGAEMRREAEARCLSVNEAHFMVHEALRETMADPAVVSSLAARDLLFARLEVKLNENEGPTTCAFGRID